MEEICVRFVFVLFLQILYPKNNSNLNHLVEHPNENNKMLFASFLLHPHPSNNNDPVGTNICSNFYHTKIISVHKEQPLVFRFCPHLHHLVNIPPKPINY